MAGRVNTIEVTGAVRRVEVNVTIPADEFVGINAALVAVTGVQSCDTDATGMTMTIDVDADVYEVYAAILSAIDHL